MNSWQAIVFDLDDTLYAESDYVLSGFRAVAAWAQAYLSLDSETVYEELKTLFDAGVRGDTFNRWLTSRGIFSETTISQMINVYREHQPVLKPFPEVLGTLEFLRPRYRLGLLSDGYLDVQRGKLAALGIADFFDAVVFSDELGRENWKPSPLPFKKILDRLSVDGMNAVYVADNPHKDFFGARLAGMNTIQVPLPNGVYAKAKPPTPAHAADFVIGGLNELKKLLAGSRSL